MAKKKEKESKQPEISTNGINKWLEENPIPAVPSVKNPHRTLFTEVVNSVVENNPPTTSVTPDILTSKKPPIDLEKEEERKKKVKKSRGDLD